MQEKRLFSSAEKYELLIRANWRCCSCGDSLEPGWHADHIVPFSKGGITALDNGQALCPDCNLRKSNKVMHDPLPFPDNISYRAPKDFQIRDWQQECLDSFMKRLSARRDNQLFSYLIAAGVGSGKTKMAAIIAADLLSNDVVRRVLYVCPNEIIKLAVKKTFEQFSIPLIQMRNKAHRHGEPGLFAGGVLTYHSLEREPQIHRRHCQKPTLVIFDEIHHLGDKQSWGEAARSAFDGTSAIILGMSGTPYRTDNAEIPFVTFLPAENGLRRFKADYPYPLGRSIADGHCRKPEFIWLNGSVKTSHVIYGDRTVTFDDDVSEETANLRLRGAVRPGSGARIAALRRVVGDCLADKRRLIIFVGGDTNSDTLPRDDASKILPDEILGLDLGLSPSDIVSVVSNDKGAMRKLEGFRNSSAPILITINMVSEGVDIPELSAALFLTSITAKSTTAQRIGRVLRGTGAAPIYMFRDKRYVEFSKEIEGEIEYEISVKRKKRENPGGEGGAKPSFTSPEAIGIDSWYDGITYNSRFYPQSDVEAAYEYLSRTGHPRTPEFVGVALGLLESSKP